MKSEGLQFFTDIHWPLVGLILFFTLFVILIWMQVRLVSKADVELLSQLPMDKDQNHERK
jgi:hypothetical protein